MNPPAARNTRLLNALRCEPVDCTPVWFMRQAGRCLPEYRKIRERHSFLEICRQPELTAEVTLQPVHALGVDGAILFADIVTPLIGIGISIDLVESVGPVIAEPFTNFAQLEALRDLEPEADVASLLEAIGLISRQLDGPGGVPLLGFAGAPFTLASYLIEGRSSRDYARTKRMMYGEPDLWHGLMGRLTEIVAQYLLAQIRAGVEAVQLFDSWAGALAPADYGAYVQPHTARVFDLVAAAGVPMINFSTGTAGFLELVTQAGGTTVGVDWRVGLGAAWDRIGQNRGIQGNLDPVILLGPETGVIEQARRILDEAAGRLGHVFNLGHGVHPETPVDTLRRLVDVVHEYSTTA